MMPVAPSCRNTALKRPLAVRKDSGFRQRRDELKL